MRNKQQRVIEKCQVINMQLTNLVNTYFVIPNLVHTTFILHSLRLSRWFVHFNNKCLLMRLVSRLPALQWRCLAWVITLLPVPSKLSLTEDYPHNFDNPIVSHIVMGRSKGHRFCNLSGLWLVYYNWIKAWP